ncbi:MAG: chemotaxis protein CheA [Deltaproteobacteria bacterium]|nr:chemotaxis protein CheA [Deltaproteobacteria bacterium]
MTFSSNEMDEIVGDFIVESSESLESLDQKFIGLEKNPRDSVLLNDIFRSVHTIKGAAGFLGFQQMVDVTHVAEDVLNKLRKNEMTMTPGIMDSLLRAIDLIKTLLKNIKERNNRQEDTAPAIAALKAILSGASVSAPVEGGYPPVAEGQGRPIVEASEVEVFVEQEMSRARITTGAEIPIASSSAPADGSSMHRRSTDVMPLGSKTDEAQPKEKEQSIRVDIERLDSVLNLAGELVLSRNRMMRLGGKLGEWNAEAELTAQFDEAIAQLDLVTTDLQLAVMKMRMQPIAKVFNKFPRMVRDLARQNNKEVDLILRGEETELDKTVIEEIGDPLVHLIRNAVDHGIETPDERAAKGKPRAGVISLSAYQEGRHIIVSVSDDGKGIDPEYVKTSAVEKGIVSKEEAEKMSHKEALNLIFIPGFTTAKQVSSISGRGVGMDVVKTNITRINGTIVVDSEVGKGMKIVFRLPLTLAIIQALTVEAGGGVYGIPLSTVVENLRLAEDDIKSIEGREVVYIRGNVYPVVRLSNLVSGRSLKTSQAAEWKYVVVTGIGEKNVGILVDKLHGQEEIVLKSMGEYLKGTEGIAGACITGDGTVILILDVAGLIESVSRRQQKNLTDKAGFI